MTMLENGLDFIIDAIIHLKNSEQDDCPSKEREIKYCLLHLSSGIELVLKSRLFREHWTYIFADMNKADKKQLEEGSLKSVESSVVIERLERLCGVKIDKHIKKDIERLRKKRNQAEHFTIKENMYALESCVNKALTAISRFISENYDAFDSPNVICFGEEDNSSWELSEKERTLIDELTQKAAELQEHYNDAKKLAEARASKECLLEELIECSFCKEKFLKCGHEDNTCYCYFCGYKGTGEALAKEYLWNIKGICGYECVKEGEEYPLYYCPVCVREALVKTDKKYQCFSCGMYYNEDEIAFCNECGQLYVQDDNICLCQSCIDYKLNKD